MRRASLPRRLDRLTVRGHAGDRERVIHEVAAETGLDPAEVRAELAAIEEEIRRFGPSTPEQAVQRIAAELRLPEDEVWAEYARITGTAGEGP